MQPDKEKTIYMDSYDDRDAKSNFARLKQDAKSAGAAHLASGRAEKIVLSRPPRRQVQQQRAQQQQGFTVGKAGVTDQLALTLGTVYSVGNPCV